MKYEDEFDGLLNEALRETREAEPRAGLEGRVLARVRAGAEERRVAWWKWAAVAVAVVVIVFAVMVRRGSKAEVARNEPEKVVVPEKKVEEAKAPSESSRETKRVRTAAVKGTQKKATGANVVVAAERAPFPAPVPMTDQEKALVMLARNNPGVLVSVDKERQVEGGEISPIEIEPIKISGIGEKAQ